MAKRASGGDEPMGPILAENLIRLGYADVVVRVSDVAKRVAEHSGKPMSRQRISQLLNAVRIEPGTIETIAAALGVKPEELTTRKPPKKG